MDFPPVEIKPLIVYEQKMPEAAHWKMIVGKLVKSYKEFCLHFPYPPVVCELLDIKKLKLSKPFATLTTTTSGTASEISPSQAPTTTTT